MAGPASVAQASSRPRVVACDLDGTLLRSDGTLDERTRRALARAEAAGALVVICSARPARWIRPLAAAAGHRGVAICANGSVVWDLHADQLLESTSLTPEVSAQVVALLRAAVPGGAWAVERADGFGHEPTYRPRWSVPPETVVDAVEVLVSQPAVKLMLHHDRLLADTLLQAAHQAVGHLVELSHSNSADSLLEISAAGVNKASALARLCARRGAAPSEVIAFGDMPNDLPMLRWAGRAVAVANAHADVLAVADEISASNDESGVAIVLERLFRGGPADHPGRTRSPRPAAADAR
jgi:Cof subfamily protein (haloacid dehalogenase superfamily)